MKHCNPLIHTMKSFVKHALSVIALAVFVFSATAVSAQVTKKADAKFNNAEYSDALRMYKKLLAGEKLPVATQSDIYTKMAKCYKELGYYNPARQWLEKAMRLNPGYVANYPLYSEVLRCNGKYLEALSYYYKYRAESDDTTILKKISPSLMYSVCNNYQNPFVNVVGQYAINTFGKKRGLQFFDGKLYYSTTGYMLDPSAADYQSHIYDYHVFCSDVSEKVLTNSLPESKMPIFVRNRVVSFAVYPGTNEIYFVALDKKGTPTLYCSQLTDSVYSKKKEVRIGGKSLPVESLAFTADGRKMIFSAYLEGKGGYGNNDLWMSKLEGKDWQEPVNMGKSINTHGDEITPFISGNTLFFSSNGQAENYGGYDIYSVSFDLPKQEVCNLKMPYNSFADDFSLVISPKGDGGFFVSTRDTSLLDDKIYSFSDIPNYTFCTGFVCDVNGRPVDDVSMTIVDAQNDKVLYMTKSGENGKYGVFLDNSKQCRLELDKENFFPMKVDASSDKQKNEFVANSTKTENIILGGFELNKPYKMEGLFHHTADVDVQNTSRLLSIAKFLKDNPNLLLYVHLFGYISSEEEFNEILNNKRISNLIVFLQEHGVSSSRVRYETYENMLPTDFPNVDIKTDKTYLLYFVICPQKTRPVLPKTKEYRRL